MAEPTQFKFEAKEVMVRWPEAVGTAVMANVFHLQASPDGILVTIGQATQPVFSGPPEQQMQRARELTEVEAQPLVRFALTLTRAEELSTALGQVITGFKLGLAQQTSQAEVGSSQ